MKELSIPEAAQDDPKSVELLRLWVANGAQWVSLNPYLYRERDRASFEAEMDKPTSGVRGDVLSAGAGE